MKFPTLFSCFLFNNSSLIFSILTPFSCLLYTSKYGRTYKAPKKDLKDLQENTKEVKMSEVEEEGANILRKRAKGKGGQSL